MGQLDSTSHSSHISAISVLIKDISHINIFKSTLLLVCTGKDIMCLPVQRKLIVISQDLGTSLIFVVYHCKSKRLNFIQPVSELEKN